MSDASVVAALRAGMAAGESFGVSPTVTVKQARGAYNTASGANADPDETDLSILLDEQKTSTDSSGKNTIEQKVILLIDDLPHALKTEDQVIWQGSWNVKGFSLDPTQSFYEAVLVR